MMWIMLQKFIYQKMFSFQHSFVIIENININTN